MSELFSRIVAMPTPFNMVVIVVFLGVAAGVITKIAVELRVYFCKREELEFKRELVDRGMTAEEIERVIHAESRSSIE